MHIVIAGMIGTGKSTLATNLSKLTDFRVFHENVDDNPFLEKMYNASPDDPERSTLLLQLFFLNEKFGIIQNALSEKNSIIDRSIYEDMYFAKKLHGQGKLTRDEYNTYVDLAEEMLKIYDVDAASDFPTILIYLKGEFDTILSQIQKRGREMEQGKENVEYFRSLNNDYHTIFNDYKVAPILEIDITDIDLTNPQIVKDIYSRITKIIEDGVKPGQIVQY